MTTQKRLQVSAAGKGSGDFQDDLVCRWGWRRKMLKRELSRAQQQRSVHRISYHNNGRT